MIYTLHSEEDTKIAYELADKYHLRISGGSDFCGTNKPDIKRGRSRENIEIPFEVYREKPELEINKKFEDVMLNDLPKMVHRSTQGTERSGIDVYYDN